MVVEKESGWLPLIFVLHLIGNSNIYFHDIYIYPDGSIMPGFHDNGLYQVTWTTLNVSYIMMPPPGQYNAF